MASFGLASLVLLVYLLGAELAASVANSACQ